MKSVSRFEANLLRILRCFLRAVPEEQALPLVFREHQPPKCLGRDCVELAEESLARGCTTLLARAGWRTERALRGEEIVKGRLWNRTPLEARALSFSRQTMQWLIWITAANPCTAKKPPRYAPSGWELGDRVLQFFAFEVLGDTLAGPALLKLPAFRTNGLLWLAWPEKVAEAGLSEDPPLREWVDEDRAWVVEALRPRLVERWARGVTEMQEISDWRQLRAVGDLQQKVLQVWLDAADEAGRWDLARWVMESAAQLLRGTARGLPWFHRLDTGGLRMADRVETYRSGLALLHALKRLESWEQRARTIGFYDEGYRASQLWKADWERWQGDSVCEQAESVIRRIQPLNVS